MATGMEFQEWLEKRAQEVNQPERPRHRSEWIAALDQFYEQIMNWIRESDPKGLLIIERMELARTEPRLGTYTAPALKISLGDAAVRVVPMGAMSAALTGTTKGSSAATKAALILRMACVSTSSTASPMRDHKPGWSSGIPARRSGLTGLNSKRSSRICRHDRDAGRGLGVVRGRP